MYLNPALLDCCSQRLGRLLCLTVFYCLYFPFCCVNKKYCIVILRFPALAPGQLLQRATQLRVLYNNNPNKGAPQYGSSQMGLTSNCALKVLKTPSQRLPDCVSTWTMSPTWEVAACMKCELLYTPSATTRPRGDLLTTATC